MSFDGYFDIGKMVTVEEWIMNPYSLSLDKMSDDGKLKDLIELRLNYAFDMCLE